MYPGVRVEPVGHCRLFAMTCGAHCFWYLDPRREDEVRQQKGFRCALDAGYRRAYLKLSFRKGWVHLWIEEGRTMHASG